jgi:hypothetical protein
MECMDSLTGKKRSRGGLRRSDFEKRSGMFGQWFGKGFRGQYLSGIYYIDTMLQIWNSYEDFSSVILP